MKRIIGGLLCAGMLSACGGAEAVDTRAAATASEQQDPGIQLASVRLPEGQTLTFYETPEHGIVSVAKGPKGSPMPDSRELQGLSVVEAYRKLSGQEAPAALVEASRRIEDPAMSALRRREPAPDVVAQRTEGGGVSAAGTPNTSWFTSNFCTGLNVEYDAMWCPTHSYASAWSGWGAWQKFYQTCGTTTDATGVLRLEKWGSGAWQRLQTVNLQTWQWACAWGWGVGQYRSGIDSTQAVLFSERFRYSIPNISAYLGDFPDDRSYPNFYNDIQGITHDAYNWYLTRNDTNWGKDVNLNGIIGRQAMTAINEDPSPRYSMPTPWYNAGFRHYGDLVHVNGLIYVAMDGPGAGVAGIGVFNTNLQYIGMAYMPNWSGGVPFLAYNPRNNWFYVVTNAFGPTTMRAFQIGVSGNTVTITEKQSTQLTSLIPGDAWIQGGKVSAHGNLYVSVGGDGKQSGIYMIDAVNGYVQTFYPIGYGASSEFEGLDLWDLDADPRIGAYGQIHLQQLHVDWPGFADDYWLAHFRVDDPSKL
ncbi:hypothetical protein JGU66_11915 [Myxococcaceae bacterium JPH2]|nr:hypothetical protein [Myxococcaceae bacterium JPH2]